LKSRLNQPAVSDSMLAMEEVTEPVAQTSLGPVVALGEGAMVWVGKLRGILGRVELLGLGLPKWIVGADDGAGAGAGGWMGTAAAGVGGEMARPA
jgi:hypothetical protein